VSLRLDGIGACGVTLDHLVKVQILVPQLDLRER
jgi:hypothetical protein